MEDSNRIKELEEQIESLETEMNYLQEDLTAADKEVEQYENQLKEYQNRKSIFITEIDVINEMKDILSKSLHNVSICTPSIDNLEKLELYKLPPSVVVKASCNIDIIQPDHQKFMDEIKSLDSVSLRLYSGRDRWSILKDGEILFMAIVGETSNRLLSLKTSDPAQIHVFKTLVMESWLRGQKV